MHAAIYVFHTYVVAICDSPPPIASHILRIGLVVFLDAEILRIASGLSLISCEQLSYVLSGCHLELRRYLHSYTQQTVLRMYVTI